jgi:hypothetical protein
LEAGITALQTWGFLNTLNELTNGIWSEREIIMTANVLEVLTEIQRRSHIFAFQKRLRDVLKNKK